jgi:hypothetical protein
MAKTREKNSRHKNLSKSCIIKTHGGVRWSRGLRGVEIRFIYFVEVPPMQEHAKVLPFITFSLVHSTNNVRI